MAEQTHTPHDVIWLQPWCAGCEQHCTPGEGRMWCQDNVWGECEECGNKPVRYVIDSTKKRGETA
jgi:hypothetical protein